MPTGPAGLTSRAKSNVAPAEIRTNSVDTFWCAQFALCTLVSKYNYFILLCTPKAQSCLGACTIIHYTWQALGCFEFMSEMLEPSTHTHIHIHIHTHTHTYTHTQNLVIP